MHLHLSNEDHHHHEHASSSPQAARIGLWVAGGLAAILAAVVVYRTLFFVDETEYVYVTQFGQPIQLYAAGGLGIKWPYQSLLRFDRRLQMYRPPAREMLTEDKENLNFQWYVCWRIPSREFVEQQLSEETVQDTLDPSDLAAGMEMYVQRFLQSVGTTSAAENRLEERIQAAVAAEIGHTRLSQLVSLERDGVQLTEISSRVTDHIRREAAEEYGIEVVDVQFQRFSYPQAVKPAVYAEIRSERERVAVQYRAEGASEQSKLESQADLLRDQLLAQAQREATTIRGEGEAKAIEILNAAHREEPQFYELLKTLESYRDILDDQTTIVLSTESPLLRVLTHGVPEPTASSDSDGDATEGGDE